MVFKSIVGATCACLAVVSFNANSALIDRGNGLIYDKDLDITWLSDANYAMTSGYDADGLMNWQESKDWAAQLEYGGFTDWRLPTTLIPDSGCTDQFGAPKTDSSGWNCTGSEMGHLFYDELGGVMLSSILNSDDTVDLEKFINIQSGYWSVTDGSPSSDFAWIFVFTNTSGGQQGPHDKDPNNFAWAVHDGDIGAVPIPSAVWLFGSGLIGLVGLARRKASA